MSNLKTEYKTVEKRGESLYVEKKSEFIGNVRPVKTEAEALDFINAVKKKYADARHNVYAYVVQENNIQRFTDDGEPSGTAGMPVLDTIRKQNLTDVAVVVTRYFGGTLLGTGGLVRAYGKAAGEAVADACPIIRRLCSIYKVECDYNISGKIEHSISGGDYFVEDKQYTDAVTFFVGVKNGDEEKFAEEITEISGGSAKIEKVDNKYINIKIQRRD